MGGGHRVAALAPEDAGNRAAGAGPRRSACRVGHIPSESCGRVADLGFEVTALNSRSPALPGSAKVRRPPLPPSCCQSIWVSWNYRPLAGSVRQAERRARLQWHYDQFELPWVERLIFHWPLGSTNLPHGPLPVRFDGPEASLDTASRSPSKLGPAAADAAAMAPSTECSCAQILWSPSGSRDPL